jgi:putative oxygen-independent coproporphyrinogen III oxidase
MTELFGIYIHWPFCKSKCPYCDFNSHVAESIDHDAWADAYEKEIAHFASLTPDKIVTSIFFGGGTPSLMRPQVVGRVIEAVRKNWRCANDVEITLEANPTSVEMQKFKDFRAAGINRVSLGVQSLRDEGLKFLGREHSAADALKAVGIARDVFDRYSFDLIYARPNQTPQAWEKELSEALQYIDGHSSLYQLTIEDGTAFKTMFERGDFSIPDEEQGASLFEITQNIMEAHGLPAYEVSNHAKSGQECLHNLTYWRYGDYVGVGPGAHGRITVGEKKKATRTHRATDIWLKQVWEGGHGAHPFENISKEQELQERMMMGLRLAEGVEGADALDQVKLEALIKENYMVRDGTRVACTPAGLQRLNGLLAYLL